MENAGNVCNKRLNNMAKWPKGGGGAILIYNFNASWVFAAVKCIWLSCSLVWDRVEKSESFGLE